MSVRARLAWGLVALVALACAEEEGPAGEAVGPEALVAHSAEFERKVYEVTDGVHVAVGYALANSILIEGNGGAIVVDVLGSVEAAREVKAAFDEITDQPIVALVYTHNHADHVFGGRGFVPEGEVEVFAHATTEYYIDRIVSIIRPIIARRSARMFGNHMPTSGPDAFINAGIGPFLEIGEHAGGTQSFIRPTRTLNDRLEVTVAGVRMELVHAPGETNDQIFVWLPDRRVLLPGDNVYKAFPNLYTIRGTLYRDVLEWARSIDAMREREPEYLVPSHTRPILGRERVAEVLTAYRDGIQYVHDQTIRGMNRGLAPDELVEFVKLPPHLRDHPYLQEFYGTVEWSVRSIFSAYLGWFDGDSTTLSPARPEERARAFAELAGGTGALLEAGRAAIAHERFAWAAELASYARRVEPDSVDARRVEAQALRELGRRSTSSNGRNFYITQALELEGEVELAGLQIDESVMELVRGIPIRNFMAAMPVNLDPEKSAETDLVVGFRFPDVDEGYTIHVRRGVAEFRDAFPEDPAIGVHVDSQIWKEIVLGQRNPALAFASDDVQIDGSALELAGFLRMFRD